MKGFCIILVILHHSDFKFPLEEINIMLNNLRMPLYFCLSGLFFKTYTCFMDFLIRKVNKLAIPFFFFCLFPRGILALFDEEKLHSFLFWRDLFLVPDGYPIWFLRCLFITYLFYYLFEISTKNLKMHYRWLVLLVLTTCCYYLNNRIHHYINDTSNYIIRYSCYQFQTMTSIMMLPLFYICQELRCKGFLNKNYKKQYILSWMIVFVILWYFFRSDNVGLLWCSFGNNYFKFYLSALSGIGFLWCICVLLKKIPIISYLGRYSLIVLGTHMPMLHLFLTTFKCTPIQSTFFVIFISLPIIWLMKKYFPYVTAQKDLLHYEKK